MKAMPNPHQTPRCRCLTYVVTPLISRDEDKSVCELLHLQHSSMCHVQLCCSERSMLRHNVAYTLTNCMTCYMPAVIYYRPISSLSYSIFALSYEDVAYVGRVDENVTRMQYAPVEFLGFVPCRRRRGSWFSSSCSGESRRFELSCYRPTLAQINGNFTN